jgi:hypothetical protein
VFLEFFFERATAQVKRSSCLEAGRRLLAARGLVALLALLREQDRVDVRDDTARRNGDLAEQTVELLVVADGELDVARHDALALVVARRVAGQLENLGGQVLEHGRHVDGRAGADARSVATVAQVAVHTAHRELQAGARRARRRLAAGGLLRCLAAALGGRFLSTSRHFVIECLRVCSTKAKQNEKRKSDKKGCTICRAEK